MPDASSLTIFSAMYKFNYVSVSSSQDHTPGQAPSPHIFSVPTIDKYVGDTKPDNPLSIDPDNFEIMNFDKPQNGMFDLGAYMSQEDWSPQSSPTDSAFAVPIVTNGSVDEHQLLPTSSSPFPLSDLPNYVSSNQLLVPIHYSDMDLHR